MESRGVDRRILRSQAYFRNCGVTLEPINVTFGHRQGLKFIKSRADSFKFGSFNPTPEGIYVVFTEDEEFNRTGYAKHEGRAANVFEKNTLFLMSTTINYEKNVDPKYDILSHELGHIILNEGHNSIPGNFLSKFYDGMDVTEDQCAKMKTNWWPK